MLLSFRHRLFMGPDYQYSPIWMLQVFSWNMWFSIIIFYFLLTIFSIFCQNITSKKESRKLMSSSVDHFFYTLAALCNQGTYIKKKFNSKFSQNFVVK